MLSNIFSLKKHSHIQMASVDLGVCRVEIPVADMHGTSPGPTFLITAGMDGDEYTGIEAAYRLIEKFTEQSCAGRLIVIPIVNIPGFKNECSHNPLDGQFPKSIFPGSSDGTPTERLINWLVSTYVSEAEVWYDMHAGAITEGLNPFLWMFETDNQRVDSLAEKMCSANIAETILLEPARWGSAPAQLAKMGCTYICAEVGSRGTRIAADIERHILWAEAAMSFKGLSDAPIKEGAQSAIVREVSYVIAPFDGMWRPAEIATKNVVKGSALGELCRIDGTRSRIVYAPATGVRLWWKETMRMQRGDVLCATGR